MGSNTQREIPFLFGWVSNICGSIRSNFTILEMESVCKQVEKSRKYWKKLLTVRMVVPFLVSLGWEVEKRRRNNFTMRAVEKSRKLGKFDEKRCNNNSDCMFWFNSQKVGEEVTLTILTHVWVGSWGDLEKSDKKSLHSTVEKYQRWENYIIRKLLLLGWRTKKINRKTLRNQAKLLRRIRVENPR